MTVPAQILVANEPATYRSLLASELPFLRPNIRVLEIDPADLDAAVSTFHPAVVICSREMENVRGSETSVLELLSEEIDAVIQVPCRTIVNPRLADILGAIDHAVTSRHPAASAA